MAIAQDAYYIPDDIATGLALGTLRRIGSVVRYATGKNKGQIVKHLDPVKLPETEQTQNFGAKALEFAKNNKKAFVIVGACIGVATVGTIVYCKIRNHEPKVLANFRYALREYIEEIRTGTLELKTIDELMRALEELKEHKDYEGFFVKLSADELDVLVNRICEYTIKLADGNGVSLSDDELDYKGNAILNLKQCLCTQKRIFEIAA